LALPVSGLGLTAPQIAGDPALRAALLGALAALDAAIPEARERRRWFTTDQDRNVPA
jgi:hypothetical protein